MAWQSIISSHPTTDPRSSLFRCGSIILLIDNLKVGSGPSLSSGSETADHLIHTCFCPAISRTIAALSCTLEAFYRLTFIEKACVRDRGEPSAPTTEPGTGSPKVCFPSTRPGDCLRGNVSNGAKSGRHPEG